MSIPPEIRKLMVESLERVFDDALLDDEPPPLGWPPPYVADYERWKESPNFYDSLEFDGPAYPERKPASVPAVVEAIDKPKTRRPSLKSIKQQAEKAGIEVARYDTRPDGTISIVPGKPEIAINEGIEITTPEQLRRLI